MSNWFERQLANEKKQTPRIRQRVRRLREPSFPAPIEPISDPQIPLRRLLDEELGVELRVGEGPRIHKLLPHEREIRAGRRSSRHLDTIALDALPSLSSGQRVVLRSIRRLLDGTP